MTRIKPPANRRGDAFKPAPQAGEANIPSERSISCGPSASGR